jgi:putative FmdB family regulatory protein
MPLYRYECQKCEHAFEELVFDGEEVVCPKCESKKLQRQQTMPGMAQVKDLFPSACGDPSLPPCGAPGCRRTGKG